MLPLYQRQKEAGITVITDYREKEFKNVKNR